MIVLCICQSSLIKKLLSAAFNKMQSKMADFAPGAATWRSQTNNVVWPPTAATIWWTVWNMLFLLFSLFRPLYENMTSSIKQKVHNISHCRHKRTEPQPQVARTEHWVKFVNMVFEICEWTDKQTIIQNVTWIAILRSPTGGVLNILTLMVMKPSQLCTLLACIHDIP